MTAPLITAPTDPSMRHRTAEATVTVHGTDGRPLADTEVTVEQLRHAFSFGNIGFDLIGYANGETEPGSTGSFGGATGSGIEQLARQWLDLFNTATLPFYWGNFEPERGQPDTARLLRTAQWFRDQGCTVKGHPLAWHTLAPDWLRELPTDEVAEVLRGRIRREVSEFAGVIDTWDAINEVVIMPGLVTYIGSTEAEAKRKKAELDALLPVEESLAQLSLFTEQDCSDWELDAPVPELPPRDRPGDELATCNALLEVCMPRSKAMSGKVYNKNKNHY